MGPSACTRVSTCHQLKGWAIATRRSGARDGGGRKYSRDVQLRAHVHCDLVRKKISLTSCIAGLEIVPGRGVEVKATRGREVNKREVVLKQARGIQPA